MKNLMSILSTKNAFRNIAIIGMLIMSSYHFAIAQEADSSAIHVEIRLLDGSFVSGELIEETGEYLTINSASLGTTTIQKSKMESFKRLPKGSLINGVYWHSTVNSSRNIFSPTGYGLKKGEGYYQNFMLFVNQFSYGFTDHFSMGVGFEIASLLFRANGFVDDEEQSVQLPAFMLTPKFSIPIKEDKWNLGLGGVAMSIPYTDDMLDFGLVYGVSTWGGRDRNVTVGLGIGATQEGINERPVLTISGNYRVGKYISLVTENWFLSDKESRTRFHSAGLRYMGQRVSFDLSLVAYGFQEDDRDRSDSGISPIPLIGVTIPMGKGWGK